MDFEKLEKIDKLFNRNELRRLEKAAKEKDKMTLAEWAMRFEEQVSQEVHRYYEKKYKEILDNSISNWLLAITYTLHFNEKTKFGIKRLNDVMSDLMAVTDGFRTGEYSPEEYVEELKKDGIDFNI